MRRSFVPLAALLVAGPAAAQPYTFSTVFTFGAANGNPNGSLVVDGFGNVYGTTSGSCGCGEPPPRTSLTNPPLTPPHRPPQRPAAADLGMVFQLTPNGAGVPYTLNALHTFAGGNTDGAIPYAGLIRDGTTLYGTTAFGGGTNDAGTVFKIDTDGNNFGLLHSFTGQGNEGYNPAATLTQVGTTLYGTTAFGGASDYGSVFKVGTNGNAFATLGSFNVANGALPAAGLAADAAGVLYGTTTFGGNGASPDGTLYRVDPTAPAIDVLVNFSNSSPNGGLAVSSGKLFGAACDCGPGGDSVYRVNLDGTGLTPVASFTGANGADPAGPLVADAAGNLYGVTQGDGTGPAANGTVFKLAFDATTSSYTLSTLYTFTGGADGGIPAGGLVLGAGGVLYGVTMAGNGTVFALTPTPEPAALGVAAAGLGAAGWVRRRRAAAG